MPDRTPDQLAAELRDLADQVDRLDDAAAPGQPPPVEGAPAKPTGLACVIGPDGKPVLTWDAAPDAAKWKVRDRNNTAAQVKEIVTVPRSVRSQVKAGQPSRLYDVVAVGPTGLESDPSDAIEVPSAAPLPSTPTPSTPAAGGVDLSLWKLTIPEVKDGKVVEIRPPALARYSDRYFAQVDGGVRFRCWHGGGTTSGSNNPRSELRERVGDDPEGYWNAGKGRHVMEWSGQVNRLTKVRPHVVVGQVHDQKNDVVVWRVEGDKLWLTSGNDPHGFLVDAAFQLGKPYTARYEIVDGNYRFAYNGTWLDYPLRNTAPSYFKVGDYLQSNSTTAKGESTDEYAEVVLHSVTVAHAP